MSRERQCEAPVHASDCPCVGCRRNTCDECPEATVDHFTPKCIANVLGWSSTQKGSKKNRQWLSRPCHREKDRTTPIRLEMVREQQNGAHFEFGDHQERLANFYNRDRR